MVKNKKPVDTPAKIKKVWEKSPKFKNEIRAEDIKPYTLFEIDWNSESGIETHISLPNEHDYKNSVSTIKLKENGIECCKASSIPCFVEWDYKIIIVKDMLVKFSIADGKVSFDIGKKE